jgi:hypothetical protein
VTPETFRGRFADEEASFDRETSDAHGVGLRVVSKKRDKRVSSGVSTRVSSVSSAAARAAASAAAYSSCARFN